MPTIQNGGSTSRPKSSTDLFLYGTRVRLGSGYKAQAPNVGSKPAVTSWRTCNNMTYLVMKCIAGLMFMPIHHHHLVAKPTNEHQMVYNITS